MDPQSLQRSGSSWGFVSTPDAARSKYWLSITRRNPMQTDLYELFAVGIFGRASLFARHWDPRRRNRHKLESSQKPVEILVIDRAEKPDAN
jgi:hypothetical protein